MSKYGGSGNDGCGFGLKITMRADTAPFFFSDVLRCDSVSIRLLVVSFVFSNRIPADPELNQLVLLNSSIPANKHEGSWGRPAIMPRIPTTDQDRSCCIVAWLGQSFPSFLIASIICTCTLLIAIVSVMELPKCWTFSCCFLVARSESLVVVAAHTFTSNANCSTILVAFDTVSTRLKRSCSKSDIMQLFSSMSHLAVREFFLELANSANSENGRGFARPVPSP